MLERKSVLKRTPRKWARGSRIEVTKKIEVIIYYQPRDYQRAMEQALEGGRKRACLVWARRHGKDFACWNYMVQQAIEKVGTYFYIFPEYSHGKRVIWNGITEHGTLYVSQIPQELITHRSSQDMRITLLNGSQIQIVGSANYDALRGTNPIGVVLSEYAYQSPNIWTHVLDPILTKNGGWAIFNSTPQGRNHFFEMCEYAKDHPDEWFYSVVTNKDTGFVSERDIQRKRDQGMSPELIDQEYYCFPKGQYVMTHRGMVDISDIIEGDVVLAHSGRWRTVLGIMNRQYEGELVRIKSFGSSEDILCTPNHPIRTYSHSNQKYEWKKAADIRKSDSVCFPKTRFMDSGISPDLVLLIAWYITEGSSFKNGLSFSLGRIEEAVYVSEILKRLGKDFKISQCRTGYTVISNDVLLIDFMKTNCGSGSHSKKIPLSLVGSYGKILLDELVKGDGCISRSHPKNSPRTMYTTTSRTLAYQVQLLANSEGVAAGVYKRKSGDYLIEDRRGKTKESYCVQIGDEKLRKDSTKLRRSKYNVCALVSQVSTEMFSGTVHNLRIQYDESYTVNGRAVHNCSFDAGVQGSYYGRLLQEARNEGRIGYVPCDKNHLVYTAWDIGISDAMAIIFFQRRGNEILIIDYYENTGFALRHYVDEVKARGYDYGKHFVPHDARARSAQTGQTFLQVGLELGLEMQAIPNVVGLLDGIEKVRGVFHRIMFDKTKCDFLLRALQNYHAEYDDKAKTYRTVPKHDWSSHSADAMRILVLSLESAAPGSSMTPEQLKALRASAGVIPRYAS